MNQIILEFDSNLQREKTTIQTLNQYSTAQLVILLTEVAGTPPTFNWVTPGGVKLSERLLFRDASLDEEGLYAYSATIYPGMTSGVATSVDVGNVRLSIRIGEQTSPYIRVPVNKSILPEQTDFPKSSLEELADVLLDLQNEKVSKSGDTMTGDLLMSGNDIKGVGEINTYTLQEGVEITDAIKLDMLNTLFSLSADGLIVNSKEEGETWDQAFANAIQQKFELYAAGAGITLDDLEGVNIVSPFNREGIFFDGVHWTNRGIQVNDLPTLPQNKISGLVSALNNITINIEDVEEDVEDIQNDITDIQNDYMAKENYLDIHDKIKLDKIPDIAKQPTLVFATTIAFNSTDASQLVAGTKAFDNEAKKGYVWDGTEWLLTTDADWENINLDWANIEGKPSTFPPSSHNHNASDINDGTLSENRLPASALIGDTTYTAGEGLSLNNEEFSVNNPFNPEGKYGGLRAQATTKEDVGLGNVTNDEQARKVDYDGHVGDTSVHFYKTDVSKTDVGLGNVEDYGIATKEQAEYGVDNDKYMTPLRVNQAIQELAPDPDLTDINTHINDSDIHFLKTDVSKVDVGLSNVDNVQQIPLTEKGANNGVAELNNEGIVPSNQLPSYISKIQGYDNLASFPLTGQEEVIYKDRSTNLIYRWDGITYTEISPSLALGETSATAYRGDRGKLAYDERGSQIAGTGLTWSTDNLNIDNPFDPNSTYANLRAQSTTKEDVGLSNIENYSIATQSEAEEGTANDKYMTPLRTAQAISELSPDPDLTDINAHINDSDIHFLASSVTKEDVGLGSVENYGTASQAEAKAGIVNDKYMTPLRTAEAIEEQLSNINLDIDVSEEFSAGVIEANTSGSLQFWRGTQAEYDNLTPDANIFYIIEED